MIGPSGIGKTTLAKKVISELNLERNLVTIYIDFGKTYSSLKEALLDLIREFEDQTLGHKSAFSKILEKLENMKKKISEISIVPGVSLRVSQEQDPPLQFFQDLMESFVDELISSNYKAVVVIDEFQNFLKFFDWSAWGLVKFFISQQEREKVIYSLYL